METFKLSILTAERPFYEGECESLTVPLSNGEFGIMAHHSNFVAAVVPGELRYTVPNDKQYFASVDGGIIKFENNTVLVLVDSAERPEEIDENRAKRALDAAREAILQKLTYNEYKITQANLARAASRLRVKSRDHKID